jgi:hypothetical protein
MSSDVRWAPGAPTAGNKLGVNLALLCVEEIV